MRRLLLIDDEPGIADFIRRAAEDIGFEVRATDRPTEFMALYASFQPTTIVLDLAMPEVDGVELMRWLADHGCKVPIMIISGIDQRVLDAASRLGEARGLRIARTLTKPIRLTTLRHAFNNLDTNPQ
jgi:DNA-binding response OmpR family regulator